MTSRIDTDMGRNVEAIGFELFNEPMSQFFIVLIHPYNAPKFQRLNPTARVVKVFWKEVKDAAWSWASATRTQDGELRMLFAGAGGLNRTPLMTWN